MWRTLKVALNFDTSFKNYVERIYTDAKSAENDPKFIHLLRKIYEGLMNASDKELPINGDYQLALIADQTTVISGFSSGLARAWTLIPATSKANALSVVQKLASNYTALSPVDNIVSAANKVGGNIVMIGLAFVSLGYTCISNILRWYRGEITGKRCVKNCIDSLASIGFGVGGGMGGAAIGSLVFPVWGTIVGGIIGGITSAQVASVLSDKLTRNLFDLPVKEAVEKAYNFFSVSHRAPNDEINRKFRAMCLQHHPDKGGNVADFHDVQFNMAVIRTARGEVM